MTLARNEIWKDDVLVWREAVLRAPQELRPRYNLGVALLKAGKQECACEVFREANALNSRDELTYAALGYCAEIKGAKQEALEFYRIAARIDPENEYARQRIRFLETDAYEGGMDR